MPKKGPCLGPEKTSTLCPRSNSMTTTLVLPQSLADELVAATQHPLETAGVLLASLVDDGKLGLRLLARQVRWVENPEYYRREHSRLSIGSGGYVNALAAAETLGATAIWVHTHPGLDSRPLASVYDRRVDLEIADLFRLRSGSAYYGALLRPNLDCRRRLETAQILRYRASGAFANFRQKCTCLRRRRPASARQYPCRHRRMRRHGVFCRRAARSPRSQAI